MATQGRSGGDVAPGLVESRWPVSLFTFLITSRSQQMNIRTDAQLHKNVVDELAFEQSVDTSKVAVAVKNGVVTLSGSVPNYAAKYGAEKAVKRVHGVGGVAEELTVDPFPNPEYTDTDIAQAARRSLQRHSVTTAQGIQLQVEHGHINLEGQVEWQFQRQNAHDAVAHLLGVKGVHNKITLKPQVLSTEIEANIKHAFERRSELDARQVTVAVSGGHVTLSGSLFSWAEREQAARAAWSALGVTDVVNHIKVDA
jgi:osmotically-inducible protein OsmY